MHHNLDKHSSLVLRSGTPLCCSVGLAVLWLALFWKEDISLSPNSTANSATCHPPRRAEEASRLLPHLTTVTMFTRLITLLFLVHSWEAGFLAISVDGIETSSCCFSQQSYFLDVLHCQQSPRSRQIDVSRSYVKCLLDEDWIQCVLYRQPIPHLGNALESPGGPLKTADVWRLSSVSLQWGLVYICLKAVSIHGRLIPGPHTPHADALSLLQMAVYVNNLSISSRWH